MKMLMTLTAAGLALSASFAPALAQDHDLQAHCEAYSQEHGTDPAGCSCLAEAADDDMTLELLGVESEADVEGLSENSKAALAACWPEPR